jgi:hypothetical protein
VAAHWRSQGRLSGTAVDGRREAVIVWRSIKAFVRFWIDYIFGDDWTVAVLIALGLVVTWRLLEAGVNAWWLLPPVVIAAAVQSLYRTVMRER